MATLKGLYYGVASLPLPTQPPNDHNHYQSLSLNTAITTNKQQQVNLNP